MRAILAAVLPDHVHAYGGLARGINCERHKVKLWIETVATTDMMFYHYEGSEHPSGCFPLSQVRDIIFAAESVMEVVQTDPVTIEVRPKKVSEKVSRATTDASPQRATPATGPSTPTG